MTAPRSRTASTQRSIRASPIRRPRASETTKRSFISPMRAACEVDHSQKIVAIARLSDDSFWSTSTDVVVTLAACTDEVI